MDISNKIVAFLGDSITHGSCATKNENIYHQIIKKDLGLKEALNFGLGGSRIARQLKITKEDHTYDIDFNLRAELLMQNDVDYLFILGGVNDCGHGVAPLGKKEDFTPYTFYGAYKMLCEKLIKRYGKDKIILMTPFKYLNGFCFRSPEYIDEMEYKNLLDYVNIIKEIAKTYNLKLIDLYSRKELNPNDREYSKYFEDGLHPNDLGHNKLAKIIEEELLKL